MFTKILFLCSAINLGDVGHTNQLSENLKALKPNIQITTIDANTDINQIVKNYQQAIQNYAQSSYVICAVGEKGLRAIANLDQQKLLNHNQAYIAASIHQYFDEFKYVTLDFLALPEGTISDTEKIMLQKKVPSLSLLFAVPASNPTTETLKKTYETWAHPEKPSLNQNSIIVMLPGDAPDTTGKIQPFTQASAKKLFDHLYHFWQTQGSKHKLIIQNGPRTGKHDPATGTVICSHEYHRGSSSETAIDLVSKYFVDLCKEKKLDYVFFNFAFELDGSTKTSNSVFNQLLYIAQNSNHNNYFILPGESVSMLGQIPLYLPSNKIIVFKPDSMNEAHENIFSLGVQRDYFSYFSENGNVVTPTLFGKRTEDDGKQVIRNLITGYYEKFGL